MAITTDGNLWSWGRNCSGQLGDSTSMDRYSPILIKDNVVSVSAGSGYTMAITADGSLWGWGTNRFGQLGDGTTTDRHEPVWIMDNVVTVSASNGRGVANIAHTMAIRDDGSLWSWGSNSEGQLGDGITPTGWGGWHGANLNLNPFKIMDNIAEVSTGLMHTLAIAIDDCLWAWGNNSRGQLGNGTFVQFNCCPEVIKCHTATGNVPDYHIITFRIFDERYCCEAIERTVIDQHPYIFEYWISHYWHYQRMLGPNWILSSDGHISVKVPHGDHMWHVIDTLEWFIFQSPRLGGIIAWWDVASERPHQIFARRDIWFPPDFNAGSIWDLAGVAVYEPMTFAAKWQTDIILDFDLDGGYADSDALDWWGFWYCNYRVEYRIGWRPDTILGDHMPTLNGWGDQIGIAAPSRDNYTFVGWYWNKCRGRCPGLMLSAEDLMQLHLHCSLFSWWPCNVCWASYHQGHALMFTAIWEPATQGNTPDPNKNLTHHYATMTASSSFHPVNTAPHFTNDNITTANPWRPANPGSGYLTARFNEAKNFNQIRIYQNGNRIQNYQLKYSNDGVTWNVLHSGTATPAAISTYPFGNTITAQYVRLVIGQSLNANPAAVFQFDIRYMP